MEESAQRFCFIIKHKIEQKSLDILTLKFLWAELLSIVVGKNGNIVIFAQTFRHWQ